MDYELMKQKKAEIAREKKKVRRLKRVLDNLEEQHRSLEFKYGKNAYQVVWLAKEVAKAQQDLSTQQIVVEDLVGKFAKLAKGAKYE
jgi:hypothetical protein